LRRHWRTEARRYDALAKAGNDRAADAPDDEVTERVAAGAAAPDLAAGLAGLARRDRDVLLLHAWADLGYAEIATALGIPVGTVRSRLHRARAHLRTAPPGGGTARWPLRSPSSPWPRWRAARR
jgi:RNA polymerase sigma factor (sigma-70 family)